MTSCIAPECNDFVYISDGAYTKEQILAMEADLLNTLQFNLNAPSPLHYLRRYSKAAYSDYKTHQLCKYLIELTIIDMKLLKYFSFNLSSLLISDIPPRRLRLALFLWEGKWWTSLFHGHLLWSSTLVCLRYKSFTWLGPLISKVEARSVAVEINNLLKKAQKTSLKAIKKKYSGEKFGEVAQLPIVISL